MLALVVGLIVARPLVLGEDPGLLDDAFSDASNLVLTLLENRAAHPEPGRYWVVLDDGRPVGVVLQSPLTFAATTTPARVGGLALSVRCLQKGGLGTVRATAAVALQQAVQVLTHLSLLLTFSIVAGTSAELKSDETVRKAYLGY